MRNTEVIPTSTIQTGLKIKLSAWRTANKQWQQRGPWAWGELIQHTKLLRNRITGGNAGFPTHHQSYKTKQKYRNRKNMHRKKDNLQSIKHRTQIMEAKYFYILAYISMRLITMGLSHRQEIYPSMAIHRWTNQPGLTENKSCSMALKFLRLSIFLKWLSAGLYRKEDIPLFASPTQP